MHSLVKFLFIASLGTLCLSFQSDRSGSIDKKSRALIAAYIKEAGGYEAIKNIRSTKITGKYIQNGVTELEVEYCVKKPGRVRYTYSHENKVIQIQLYNNGEAVQYTNGKKEPLNKLNLLFLKRDIHIYPLAFLDSLEATAIYQGKKEYNKHVCLMTLIDYPFGQEETYFDPKTNLLYGCFSLTNNTKTVYYDFREVDGIRYPFKSKFTYGDGHVALFEVSSIEFNREYADEYFEVK